MLPKYEIYRVADRLLFFVRQLIPTIDEMLLFSRQMDVVAVLFKKLRKCYAKPITEHRYRC